LPAARLHEAKTYVLRHLGQSSLSAAHVAAHLGVTPRYIHMLFAAEPMSFSQFVLAERLARAHRMLSEPRYAGETISAIAYAVGFADLSHFNRSFRQRYAVRRAGDARSRERRELNARRPLRRLLQRRQNRLSCRRRRDGSRAARP
jgi:AraC-like DNA-binding protein